jgi:hypothetical protein
MFAVGDRVEVSDSINDDKVHLLTGLAATVIKAGVKGTVVDITERGLYVVDFDVPETPQTGVHVSDYKQWWLPPKDLIPVRTSDADHASSVRKDELANRYTNSVCYDDLGLGLKELIDRLVAAEDKLETIHNITKKENT